jgi:bifunctional non-homologous end joining protein LigD
MAAGTPAPTVAAVGDTVEVDVEGRRLTLTNLDKVLFPETGATKADVIDYYRRVAPALLPHLRRRPPTLVRAPDGVDGERFFEKRCPGHRPPWVATATVGRYGRHRGYEGCVVDDLPSLVWIANLAAIELHVHQATIDDPEHPTAVVLDLDPGPPATIVDCCTIALEVRDVLARLDLYAVVKTSGGAGLHLSVPLAPGRHDSEQTTQFALALGQLLERRMPARVTTTMAKRERHGKVLVDWSQNHRAKTTVAPYSLRLRATNTVSTPITWHEVEAAAAAGDGAGLAFRPAGVLARLDDAGDHYAANLAGDQVLPALPRS